MKISKEELQVKLANVIVDGMYENGENIEDILFKYVLHDVKEKSLESLIRDCLDACLICDCDDDKCDEAHY